MVKVKVPATSANLGPGFDCLGLALGLYNYIEFERRESGLSITGCDPEYSGEDNLAYVSFLKTLDYADIPHPEGLSINIESFVPVSRGLGSSATMIVAGIAGADALYSMKLSKKQMLLIANSIEGHPDNVSPAIFGGLTSALVTDDEPVVMEYAVDPALKFTALIPDYETSTEKARALLPEMIKRKDAVYTAACLARLLKALETGDNRALSKALDDKLHQPYRKELIPGFDDIRALAIKNGAAGLVISGSGSTLLAVGGGEGFDLAMKSCLEHIPGNWQVMTLDVDAQGVVVI